MASWPEGEDAGSSPGKGAAVAFDLKFDVSIRFQLVDTGEELAKLAQFAGDFGLRIRTEVDSDRERGGWVVVLDGPGYSGADSTIQALVYARALASGTSISRVLDDARRELMRNTGQDPDVIVGNSPAQV